LVPPRALPPRGCRTLWGRVFSLGFFSRFFFFFSPAAGSPPPPGFFCAAATPPSTPAVPPLFFFFCARPPPAPECPPSPPLTKKTRALPRGRGLRPHSTPRSWRGFAPGPGPRMFWAPTLVFFCARPPSPLPFSPQQPTKQRQRAKKRGEYGPGWGRLKPPVVPPRPRPTMSFSAPPAQRQDGVPPPPRIGGGSGSSPSPRCVLFCSSSPERGPPPAKAPTPSEAGPACGANRKNPTCGCGRVSPTPRPAPPNRLRKPPRPGASPPAARISDPRRPYRRPPGTHPPRGKIPRFRPIRFFFFFFPFRVGGFRPALAQPHCGGPPFFPVSGRGPLGFFVVPAWGTRGPRAPPYVTL